MDYKDVLENAEKVLNEGLSSINDYPNDDIDVEVEIQEIQQLDSKLQVVREALLVFARGFSTSRPLLLKMHELYSSAIKLRNTRLDEYTELTRDLLGIKHVRMDPIAYFQRKSKEKWEELVQEKMCLLSTVDSLKNALEDMHLKMDKLRNQLENSETQIKVEYQARLSALMEMKNIEERIKHQVKKRENLCSRVRRKDHFNAEVNPPLNGGDCTQKVTFTTRSKDPIFLEEVIQTCQKAYSELSTEMCTLKVMYSDSVPLKRFEALEELVNALKKRKIQLQDIIGTLEEENRKLTEENEKSHEENKEAVKKIHELENGSSILVSHWNRCAEYLPGGIERWKKITKGMNNAEKLEILVKEVEIMSAASKYYEDNFLFS